MCRVIVPTTETENKLLCSVRQHGKHWRIIGFVQSGRISPQRIKVSRPTDNVTYYRRK